MKILGIGVDIVKNSRVSKSLKNNHFIKRIFSNTEILIANKIKDKKGYYSKRFAAKEAFAKALGTGFRDGLNFKDIEVVNDKLGKPYFVVSSKIKNLIKKKKKIKNFNLFLSISDEKEYSIAFTIIQAT
jgi:holo-[acyl-carrier protein] synthase